MVMIKDLEGKERYSVSTDLFALINRLKVKINDEDSMVLGIVFGDVGSGKSVRTMHIGHAVDPTIDVDRVCFDKDEFIRAVIKHRKKVIIGDEGISLFFSRASMTKEGRLMSELMAQCRQKNLCILICVPEILSVDWLVLNAANFIAYVWESTKMINGRRVTVKGNTAFYPNIPGNPYKDRMIKYLKGKRATRLKNFKRPDPWLVEAGNPIGETFKNPWYPIGEEKYRLKKESILSKYTKPKEEEKPKVRTQTVHKNLVMKMIKKALDKNPNLTDGQLATAYGYSRTRVNQLRNQLLTANPVPNINYIGTKGKDLGGGT